MTNAEIKTAEDLMQSMIIILNSYEFKSENYLHIRDKMDYFCEFMELFGYEWCEDGFFYEAE